MGHIVLPGRCTMGNGSRSEADLRQERRAAALRENLRRRKAQARAQATASTASSPSELTPETGPAPLPDPSRTQGN